MENIFEDDASSVRVAVRIRPLIGREKVERCDECVSVLEAESQIVMGKNRAFTYDYTFGKYAQQSDIWRCVEPLVKANFDGYNATIFAYGQTGSGKTFTMGSGSCVHIAPDDYGIIPRVISYMFDQLATKAMENPLYKSEIRIRFLEIYGEDILDLLVHFGDARGDNKVTLREAESGAVQVTGAIEELVQDADECLRLLERGTLARTTGSTLMNAQSSRSHAIFTVTMVQHIPIGNAAMDDSGAATETEYETRSSYFNFVDLAGSERQKRTQAEGKRLKEGIDINKGLLALGNVISALGDDKKRGKVHVPYRDSKLTRMLQDSLGGNSRTLMLTCVSPADVNFEETLNALKYANRARNIKNKAVVNRDEGSMLTLELQRQVQMLQAEIHRLRNPGLSDSELNFDSVDTNGFGLQMDFNSFGNLRLRAENAEGEVARLTGELKRNRILLDSLKEEMIAAQAERDYLRLCLEDNPAVMNATPDEREAKTNILAEQLRTIHDLQEKLRTVERERDRAILSSGNSGLLSVAFQSSPLHLELPEFVESDIKMGNDLIERAESEIEKETAILTQMKTGGESIEESGNITGDDADADMANATEQSQEDDQRQEIFHRRQDEMGKDVDTLAYQISVKQQMVQKLREAQANYDRLKSFYEQKMAQMVEEARILQMDRDKLFEEIQYTEAKLASEGDTSGRKGRLAKLQHDLSSKDQEIVGLRKKQAAMDHYLKEQKKNEAKIRILSDDLSGMKRQKVDLIKKMQDERKRYEQEANHRRREIMSLKRSQQRDKQQIQRLGSQKDAQERVLKRKMEEVNAVKLRLKHQQQLQAQAKRKNATYGRRKGPPTAIASEESKEWLSEAVKMQAHGQQKRDQLEEERNALAKEMEMLYAQRDQIEAQLKQQSMSSEQNIRDILISPMKTSPLGQRQKQLSPEEEQILFDLEERIEACQAQLEYKEEQISEIADSGRGNGGGPELVKIVSTQSLPEARTLLKMLFSMAVDVKKQEQQKDQDITKLQVEIVELNQYLEEERDKTKQLKQSYEESMQRVTQNGVIGLGDSSSSTDELDGRIRILLAVAEERSAMLTKKCEDLEHFSMQTHQEKQALSEQIATQHQELLAIREKNKRLEIQLSKLSAAKSLNQASELRKPMAGRTRQIAMQVRADQIASAAKQGPRSVPPSAQKSSGPVSWVNEFDDEEDENMTADDKADGDDDDVVMKESESESGLRANQDRSEFRVELQHMGDNLDSISLAERNRRAQITQRRDDADNGEEHNDSEDSMRYFKEDSPTVGSDDSSATTLSTGSIFNRLSNPSNFTGIHKNRVKESVSKREVLQNRLDRNRSRRLRDRGSMRAPRAVTPTERSSVNSFGFKLKKTSPVLEVLATMKRENESEQFAMASNPTPSAAAASDRAHEYSDDSESGMISAATVPPPAPQVDVYSRLAGQYTASAQSKRQTAAVVAGRRAKSDRPGIRHTGTDDEGYMSSEQLDTSAHVDDEATYDPLLGTGSLVDQVHEDYRERLNFRSVPKAPSSARF